MNYHPWRELREQPQLSVEWSGSMPTDMLGATVGDTIWMSTKQSQAERRCTVTHEMIHIELGHIDGCSNRDELLVRKMTARRLIAIRDLAAALRWTLEPAELAEELWVDVDVLTTRLEHLHPAERHCLRRATEHHGGDHDHG